MSETDGHDELAAEVLYYLVTHRVARVIDVMAEFDLTDVEATAAIERAKELSARRRAEAMREDTIDKQ